MADSPDSSLPLPDPVGLPAPNGQFSNALYQVFEQTPAYVVIMRGPEHRLEYCNPAFERLYAGRELLGRPVSETQSEAVAQGFVALLDKVYNTGEIVQATEVFGQVEDATGGPPQQSYYDYTYQPFRENGQIVGVSVFAFDVTERVLLRQAQQVQLQVLFEQAPVAIAILQGPQYTVEVANGLIGKLWGREVVQVLGRPLFSALPEVRGQGFEELLAQVLATGKALVAQEVPARLERNGRLEGAYFNFVYQPLRDATGQLTRIAVVATEVSEQVANRQHLDRTNQQLSHTNAELDLKNQQLLRTNADLDNFIYTASHDLKAPISNIEGLLTALLEELNQPEAESQAPLLLDLMRNSVERFKRTIEHLTDITKLQKADAQPIADIELSIIVEAVRLDLRPQFEETHAQLLVDVAQCPTVAFSEKNLRSVVYNLLSNALKYHHPDRVPQVQVRCLSAGSYTVLEVQDNGLGLSPVQQQKLFGMFRRLHDHVEGSGIGLYMVKKIMDNAGGRIEVASQLGIGSTFRVYFPR